MEIASSIRIQASEGGEMRNLNMKQTEYKTYEIHVEEYATLPCSLYFRASNPTPWAAELMSEQRFHNLPPETKCRLIETWNHKVGKSWRADKSTIKTWTLGELREWKLHNLFQVKQVEVAK
jgi:hypothetical protein